MTEKMLIGETAKLEKKYTRQNDSLDKPNEKRTGKTHGNYKKNLKKDKPLGMKIKEKTIKKKKTKMKILILKMKKLM